MVNNGDTLTYTGTWVTGAIAQTVNDLVSAVSSDLAAQGIAVRSSNVNQGLGNIFANLGVGGQFTITLTLQVENGLGFNSVEDVISIIRGAVYQESGQMPLADSIPYGGPAGSTPTGQPVPTTPAAGSPGGTGCIAGTSNDLTGSWSISCWFSNLTTQGLSTVGMLVLIAIVGLILLSKTEKVVA